MPKKRKSGKVASYVKLLGITIEREIRFDELVSQLCSTACRKLSALSRMSNFLSFDKRRIRFKAFLQSQFKYCALTWMLHSRYNNKQINRLNEEALRIAYGEYEL